MPSSKRSVRGLSLAVVPLTAVAALLAALGYASDAPSVLLYVAAPAAVLSAGLLVLSRWRAGRAERPDLAEQPSPRLTGGDRGPVPAGSVPGAAPGTQDSAEPAPMADEADRGSYGSESDVFGAAQPPAAPAPAWNPAAPAPSWGPAPAPSWGPAPAPSWSPAPAEAVPMAVAGQPRARLMTVIAELSGCLSLVVSVIALIKEK